MHQHEVMLHEALQKLQQYVVPVPYDVGLKLRHCLHIVKYIVYNCKDPFDHNTESIQPKMCPASNNLNYLLSKCSKCPPSALTHAQRRVRHCLIAVSIIRRSSSSHAVMIRERSSLTSVILVLYTFSCIIDHTL